MKTINFISILFYVVLLGSGCSENSTEDPTQILEFKTVEKTQNSGITEQRFVTVKDANTWNELWAEHTKNVQPPPSAPLIDFKEDMVLGVFLGTRPNTCYSVTIDSVEQVDKKRLLVKYREENKTSASCGAAITHPTHLISLKSRELPVEFIALQ
jgi:hypothetical protein